VDAVLRDLRHAVRGLVARPAYALVVTATLTLVIGAATAVLAVVNATLVRPLPFPHGDRLVQLFLMPPGQSDWTARNPQSVGTFLRFREHVRQAELVEGMWVRERALGGDTEPEVVVSGAVSAGLFTLFGGPPALGRTFTEDEDRANAQVVVLGHGIWERRFGRDPAILGRTVLIDRAPHEVIGVMPAEFATGFTATDLWTPLNATGTGIPSGNTVIQTFARLRPEVTVAQFQAELQPLMQSAAAENPTALTGWSALAVDLRDAQFRLQRSALFALAGGVGALLLIACANLANLSLTRIRSRRAELALRAALGGGRAALVRLQLIEVLLLAAAGAVAGLVVGRWTLPALLALDPSLARTLGNVHLDVRVQIAAALAAAIVTAVSGLVPLWRELGADLIRTITSGVRSTGGSPRDVKVRSFLAAAECALCVVLLACGALLLGSFERTSRIDPGYDPKSVFTAQVRLAAAAYPTQAERADVIARLLDRVRAVPGVQSAGATLNRFVPGFYFVTRVQVDGKPTPDGQPHVVHFRRATPGYFETMRIPVLRGRDFAPSDTLDRPGVAVVSRQMADRFWPGEDPIGRRVHRGTTALTVIGVVGDVRDVGFTQPPSPTIYVAFSQNNVAITPVSLVVRTAGDPMALAGAVRAAVLSVDPQQPMDSPAALERFLADSLGPQRFRSALLVILSVIGLALAALGVYATTSRAVTERTRELGVRLALGATPASLARQVVWHSMRAVLIGLAAGVALAVPAVAALLNLVPNLERADVQITAPAVLVLAIVAAVASAVPSRRALALAPLEALRQE
jgi:putative ABC transport system permease protein